MESKEVKLVLTILKNEIYFDSCEVFGFIYNLEKLQKLIIDIPKYVFAESKERKTITFKLIKNAYPPKAEIFKFNIYYGINKAYCFLDSYKFTIKLFEICFYKPAKIKYNEELLTETDYFENDSRTRIVLINSPLSLSIDDALFTMENFKVKGCNENSFEVALFNTSKNYYASKLIKEREEFSLIQKLKFYSKEINELYDNISILFGQKEKSTDKYLSIIKNYNIPMFIMNFSQRKSILKNEFRDLEEYKLMYRYMLEYAIGSYYEKKKEKFIPIIDLLDCIEKSYQEFLIDEDLLIYEKIMLIYSKILYIMSFTSINEYEQSNLTY